MTYRDLALPLIARNLSVIPIQPVSKIPLAGWGVTRKTRDLDQLPEGEGNIAVVADADTLLLETDNLERLTTLLKNEGAEIPRTFTVESRPNRCVFYFRHTPKTLQYGKNAHIPGYFELRAFEQYVVSAGSIHPKTNLPYRIVDESEIVPIPDKLFDTLLFLKGEQSKLVEKVRVQLTAGQKIGEGEGRHYAILDFCAKHAANADVYDDEALQQLFEDAMEFNHANCDPPHSAEHVASIVNWFEGKEPAKRSIKLVFGPAPARKSKFILGPRGKFDGLFPKGHLSIAYGSSGSCKSTILLQMLAHIKRGEPFWNHPTEPVSVLWLQQDRSIDALHETLDRMNLPRDFVQVVGRIEERDVAAVARLSEILKEHGQPEMLIIDRLDMIITDRRGPGILKTFTPLQKVAEGHACAIVGLWGSPKRMSTREAYKAPRDAATGASEVGSMAATMLWCQQDHETRSIRRFHIEHRNATDESYQMAFAGDDGWLHENFDRMKIGQLSRINPIALVAILQQSVLSRIAHYQPADVGFQKIV